MLTIARSCGPHSMEWTALTRRPFRALFPPDSENDPGNSEMSELLSYKSRTVKSRATLGASDKKSSLSMSTGKPCHPPILRVDTADCG